MVEMHKNVPEAEVGLPLDVELDEEAEVVDATKLFVLHSQSPMLVKVLFSR